MSAESRTPLRIAGTVAGAPNTVLGLLVALAGVLLGARVRKRSGAFEAIGHPLLARGTALCLGDVVCYGRDAGPETLLANGHSFEEHERQHTIQSRVLGPLYLPLHLLAGAVALLRDRRWHGPSNWLERGPQGTPPRPW